MCQKVLRGEVEDACKSDMQLLHGFLQGVIADGKINDMEISALQSWILDHDHLKRIWTYDEIDSLLTQILKDGVVDDAERLQLLAFLSNFCELKPDSIDSSGERQHAIHGICATCPDIEFVDQKFCFTGSSDRMNRNKMEAEVLRRGGTPTPRVTKDLNYLVIGMAGNPCWAFACYGRKVELAMNYRREGSPIVIVHESDFFDALS